MTRPKGLLHWTRLKTVLHKVLIACCALYLSGAHWVMMQTVAWTTMVVERSGEMGLPEAVESTFSGEKPCGMCKAIAHGKEEEQKQAPEIPLLKAFKEVQFVSSEAAVLPERRLLGAWTPVELEQSSTRRAEAPLLPPPRRALS